jgi:hypothetical protein
MSKFRATSRLETQSPGNVRCFLFVADNSRRLTSEHVQVFGIADVAKPLEPHIPFKKKIY